MAVARPGPVAKITLATVGTWLLAQVSELSAYLGTVESFADVDPLVLTRGALEAILPAAAALFALLTRPPQDELAKPGQRAEPESTPAPPIPAPVPAPADGLSSYFTIEEFACKGQTCECETPPIHARLIELLTEVRVHFGTPVIIGSGYRCPIHNAEVGGSGDSYHMKGMAADIRVVGVDPDDVYSYLDAKYPGQFGLGLYRSFVHVDSRRGSAARKTGPQAVWKRLPDIELA